MTTGQHQHEEVAELERRTLEVFDLTTSALNALDARLATLEERLSPTTNTLPAPTPAPIPASDVTIWKAGSAPIAGVLGRHALPDRITKVTGGYQYEVRPTDGEVSGPGGRRAEEFGYHKWREGDEVSIVLKGFEVLDTFNTIVGWAIHLQAAEYGSPHWQLKSDPARTLEFVVEDGNRNFRPQWAAGLHGPTDIGLSIRWSQGTDGIIAARVGEWEPVPYRGPTLSDTSEAYLKWGAYCGGGAARKVIIQDVRWAPGLGRIQELRGY
jgi:hypothetical protein